MVGFAVGAFTNQVNEVITFDELFAVTKNIGKTVRILDVRQPDEYKSGFIPGAGEPISPSRLFCCVSPSLETA